MADSGALKVDADEESVLVAIGRDAFDGEAVAGAFAFEPELLAGAAVKVAKPGSTVRRKASSFMWPTMRTRLVRSSSMTAVTSPSDLLKSRFIPIKSPP